MLERTIDSNCKQINLIRKKVDKIVFQRPRYRNHYPQSRSFPILPKNLTYLQPMTVLPSTSKSFPVFS